MPRVRLLLLGEIWYTTFAEEARVRGRTTAILILACHGFEVAN